MWWTTKYVTRSENRGSRACFRLTLAPHADPQASPLEGAVEQEPCGILVNEAASHSVKQIAIQFLNGPTGEDRDSWSVPVEVKDSSDHDLGRMQPTLPGIFGQLDDEHWVMKRKGRNMSRPGIALHTQNTPLHPVLRISSLVIVSILASMNYGMDLPI
jgi:hypothetical protein